MSSNRSARQSLEKQFGKICMIEQLGIRNIPKDQRRKIKGYTKYDDIITYHHIKEKQDGGKATDENGALIRGYNHRWLHSLPEDQKQKVNNSILEFKATVLQLNEKGIDIEGQSIQLDFDMSDCIEIPLIDNTKQDIEKRNKFNRAKQKRDTQKMIDEILCEEEEYEK